MLSLCIVLGINFTVGVVQADPAADLPEPTWEIELHDDATGAATGKVAV